MYCEAHRVKLEPSHQSIRILANLSQGSPGSLGVINAYSIQDELNSSSRAFEEAILKKLKKAPLVENIIERSNGPYIFKVLSGSASHGYFVPPEFNKKLDNQSNNLFSDLEYLRNRLPFTPIYIDYKQKLGVSLMTAGEMHLYINIMPFILDADDELTN